MNLLKHLMKPFRKSSSREGLSEEDLAKIAAQEQKVFTFETLFSATKGFHETHKLGEGGFGPVYKGKLNDGRDIAVKKLSRTSNQSKKEFINEVKLLSRVQHRNVVNLLGYCTHGADKLLAYEFVSNESLDKLLFKSNRRRELDWKRRFEIIVGVARGLLYLHEDAPNIIIHRDIKASNILLDDKWVPKIADFGMARLFPEDQTHVNTRVAGTNGYMAPEYLLRGHLTTSADVYSFGVVILELVSGQRNLAFNLDIDSQNLLDWAYKLYKKGRSLEILDPAVVDSAEPEQVKMCVQLGLLCAQGDMQRRPSMRRVIVALSRKPGHLEEPGRPGILGSRQRGGSSRPSGISSSGISRGSSSGASHTSLNTNTATAGTSSASDHGRTRSDPHGKRPMQSF